MSKTITLPQIETIFDIIGRDPLEWRIVYDMLGWGIARINGEMTVMLSQEKAMHFARFIKQASQIYPELP